MGRRRPLLIHPGKFSLSFGWAGIVSDECVEACAIFDRGEPWWPAPLLRALMQRRPDLGAMWVVCCARKLLPRIETPKQAELMADLAEFQRIRERLAPDEEFHRRAEEMWYRPNRDAAQTALSRLCWALGGDEQSRPSAVELRRALSVLIGSSPRPRTHMELCLAEYQQLSGLDEGGAKPVAET